MIMLVLARFLTPDEFGAVAIVMIFISLSQVFVDSGISTALIRKGTPSDLELSTGFVFNLIVSVILFLLLYISSESISNLYQNFDLVTMLKVACVNIIINGFTLVFRVKLLLRLEMKKIAISSFCSVCISSIVGLYLAINEKGAWALIFQTITFNIVSLIVLASYSNFKISFQFSKEVFKNLYSFSYKVMLHAFLEIVYKNIHLFFVSKIYSIESLGYLQQARKLTEIPSANITSSIQRVNFSKLAKIKDNSRFNSDFKTNFNLVAIALIPGFIYSCLNSDKVISILFNDNWVSMSMALAAMSLIAINSSFTVVNYDLLQLKGNSNLLVKVSFISKVISLLLIFVSFPFGFEYFLIIFVLTSFLTFVISLFAIRKYVAGIVLYQFYFMLKLYLISFVSLIIVNQLSDGYILNFIMYISVSYLMVYLILNKQIEHIVNYFKGS
ncbi:lipopolysaccharide biosynthesis protein [Vibrio fluvialis]|nr:lipopolysaccharide biosynthesis protein [Vibrio fluvialis]